MSRDRILEQALRQELRSATSTVTESCLDAETLAAWSDGALDAAQTALAEAHVSSCARCQSLVSTLARGTAAREALKAPEARQALWRFWAPIAAGVAAMTLWMVVPEQQEIATAPPQTSVRADAPLPAAPPAPERQAIEARPLARTDAPDAQANRTRENRQPPREEKKEAVLQLREEAPVAAARDAAAARPPAAAPPSPQAAASPAVAGLRRESRLAFAPLEVTSPVALMRWRASSSGIERSEDGGATWTLVRPASGDAIVAGSSPAPTICWLVGPAGVVLVTTDGRNFVRVEVPGRDDLVAVTATDAQNATVTTAGGRTLRTQDGGTSWR